MKLFKQPKALLVGAIAFSILLAIVGCKKRDIDLNGPGSGDDPLANTYVTVSLNIGSMSNATRATTIKEDTEHHNPHTTTPEWEGRDRIDKLIIYLFDDENQPAEVKSFEGEHVPQPNQEGKITLKPWKTTEGFKTIYAIINPSPEIEQALTVANTSMAAFDVAYRKDYDFLIRDKAEFDSFWNSEANKAYIEAYNKAMTDEYKNIPESVDRINAYLWRNGMVKPTIAYTYLKTEQDGSMKANEVNDPTSFQDVIMMTGNPVTKNILPNVSENEASQGANTLSVVLRRAVAQVAVTLNGKIFFDENTFKGYFDRKQGLSIGTKGSKLYGLRWTVQQYEKKSYLSSKGTTALNTESTMHSFISTTTQPYNSTGYYYLPTDQLATEVEQWYDVPSFNSDYVPLTKESLPTDLANPTFWTGNSKNSPSFYSNSRFIPETTHTYDENSYRKGNTAYYVVSGILVPAASQMAPNQTPTEPNYEGNRVVSSTLYYGIADGLYYTDYATAYRANNGGQEPPTTPTDATQAKKLRDNLITYANGYCFYIAWVNPDTNNSKTWGKSPIVRNNFYHMNITGFSKPGYSGIPLIPTGDHPLTPDPDDPVPGPDEPLKDAETHMNASVTVQGWGVHAYEITF